MFRNVPRKIGDLNTALSVIKMPAKKSPKKFTSGKNHNFLIYFWGLKLEPLCFFSYQKFVQKPQRDALLTDNGKNVVFLRTLWAYYGTLLKIIGKLSKIFRLVDKIFIFLYDIFSFGFSPEIFIFAEIFWLKILWIFFVEFFWLV